MSSWAQEHNKKSLYANTVCHVHKCRLKLYHAEKKPYVNIIQKQRSLLWVKAHLKWSEAKWETVLWSEGFHPSIHFLPLNPSVGSRGGWSLSQQSSVASPSQGHIETNVTNNHACFWTVGGSRSTRREPTHTT